MRSNMCSCIDGCEVCGASPTNIFRKDQRLGMGYTSDPIVLEEALRQVSLAFDAFIGACTDGEGKQKEPTCRGC